VPAHGPQENPDHRLGADRHRPGVRVRLLGHPGGEGASRGGFERRPRELEPRDDHDRPGAGQRNLRGAAHARVRPPRSSRARAAPGAAPDARRPDGPEPRGRARRGRTLEPLRVELIRRKLPAIRRRGPPALQGGDGAHRPRVPRSGYARKASTRRARSSVRSATRRSSGRRHAWVARVARSPTTRPSSRRPSAGADVTRLDGCSSRSR